MNIVRKELAPPISGCLPRSAAPGPVRAAAGKDDVKQSAHCLIANHHPKLLPVILPQLNGEITADPFLFTDFCVGIAKHPVYPRSLVQKPFPQNSLRNISSTFQQFPDWTLHPKHSNTTSLSKRNGNYKTRENFQNDIFSG